jgi:hypothetical protein
MIRYTLKCDKNHEFDGWFPSAEGFERLRASRLTTCPVCGSAEVTKTLMAPQVHGGRSRSGDVPAPAHPAALAGTPGAAGTPAPPGAQVSLSAPDTPLAKAIARLRAEVEASSDYVGANFVREARAMHHGETPERAIHGEAHPGEARALAEDGIPILPLPFSNRTKSN